MFDVFPDILNILPLACKTIVDKLVNILGSFGAFHTGVLITDTVDVSFHGGRNTAPGFGGGGYSNLWNQFVGFYLAPGNTSGTPYPAPRGLPSSSFKPNPVYRYLGYYQVGVHGGPIVPDGTSTTVPGAITWNYPTISRSKISTLITKSVRRI